MKAVRIGNKWHIPDECIELRESETLSVCVKCGFVLGIKHNDTKMAQISDGLCSVCLNDQINNLPGKNSIGTSPPIGREGYF